MNQVDWGVEKGIFQLWIYGEREIGGIENFPKDGLLGRVIVPSDVIAYTMCVGTWSLVV